MSCTSNGEVDQKNDTLGKEVWCIGLLNCRGKYLTAETFGHSVNANGTSMKKKQIWCLESFNNYVCLRSHLDRYLAVDQYGNIRCDSLDKDSTAQFALSFTNDGKWLLRNVSKNYYLGLCDENLVCNVKSPDITEQWIVHLVTRPQTSIRSVGRKRYAQLSPENDHISVNANIAWGDGTLFTLKFLDGKYVIHTSNNKYLTCGGKLYAYCNNECLFSLEYHNAQFAFKDWKQEYLSPVGPKAILKSRSQVVSKDELFLLEDTCPQACFMSCMNNRYVSVKQGVDVTANQDEVTDFETFQLEFDRSTKRWYIRTMQDKYWTFQNSGGIQACNSRKDSNGLFKLIWNIDGTVELCASNGKLVTTKKSGHLYCNVDPSQENSRFYFYLMNRSVLVLKCEQGFVGMKSDSYPKLECNKCSYDTINIERGKKGEIHIKGPNGRYWKCSGEEIYSDSELPENFYIEIIEPGKMILKTSNGKYLKSGKNGLLNTSCEEISFATIWEY